MTERAGDPAGAGTPSPDGSFTFEVLLEAPTDRVWQALVRGEQRSRWLRLPGHPGPQTAVDLEQGATETLQARATIGDHVEDLRRDTYVVDVAPGRRLVLVYRAVVNARPRWVSLITVHLDAPPSHDLTRMTWTEQYTFLTPPSADDVAHLRGGTRLLLTALAVALGVAPRPAAER